MNMTQLQGKVVAITGAGGGIGAATARECAARGASGLALSDINPTQLAAVVKEIQDLSKGVDVVGTAVDVADSDQVDAWITQTVQHFGRLDGAANVAGVEGPRGGKVFVDLADLTNDHWDFVMGVNLRGLFYCLRAQLRVMGRGASILNVASMAGVMGRPGIAAYSASKHGVVGLSRTAAKEYGEKGIRVNILAPYVLPELFPRIHTAYFSPSNKKEAPSIRPCWIDCWATPGPPTDPSRRRTRRCP
jgi:NAD(P)-dependent dehydrogenase (short-subunit alcohol dehydrogenase family)